VHLVWPALHWNAQGWGLQEPPLHTLHKPQSSSKQHWVPQAETLPAKKRENTIARAETNIAAALRDRGVRLIMDSTIIMVAEFNLPFKFGFLVIRVFFVKSSKLVIFFSFGG
jgi:hypothetical protein